MRLRWLAAAALYFLFFFRLAGMGLIGPDEPRYAWVGRAMAQSGDWITPRLWGEPWFEKPPLNYWMTAAAFRLGLDEDWAPRLPVAILSVAFLIFFYWRMAVEFGRREAEFATAVLATAAGWVAYSHAAVFDVPLTATFAAAMLALLAWFERGGRWLVVAAALLGASMLAKGLVGPALAALIVLGWALRLGTAKLRAMLSPASLAVFFAIAAPWYALCWARHGTPFLREFFWRHHIERFVAGALEHNQPVWYFLPVLAIGLLPWTPLVARLGAARVWHDRKTFFLALWAAVTLAFFSISRDKLPAYVLPALPALAGLVGIVLARAPSLRITLPLSAAMLGLVPVAAGVLPDALESGLTQALKTASWPAAALAAAAAIVAAVIWLEHKGRRAAAVAVIALGATVGYAWIAWRTFPEIEARTGTRLLGRHAADRAGNICLGETTRRVAYGVQYYAGRPLPSCDDQPRRLRIEGRSIVAIPDF